MSVEFTLVVREQDVSGEDRLTLATLYVGRSHLLRSICPLIQDEEGVACIESVGCKEIPIDVFRNWIRPTLGLGNSVAIMQFVEALYYNNRFDRSIKKTRKNIHLEVLWA